MNASTLSKIGNLPSNLPRGFIIFTRISFLRSRVGETFCWLGNVAEHQTTFSDGKFFRCKKNTLSILLLWLTHPDFYRKYCKNHQWVSYTSPHMISAVIFILARACVYESHYLLLELYLTFFQWYSLHWIRQEITCSVFHFTKKNFWHTTWKNC